MRTAIGVSLLIITSVVLGAATQSDEADLREQLFKLQKDNARLTDQMTKLTRLIEQQSDAPACAEAALRTAQLETQIGALHESLGATQARLDEALAEIRALRLATSSAPVRPVPSPASGTTSTGNTGTPSSGTPSAATPPAPDGAAPANGSTARPPSNRSPIEAFQAGYSDYSRRLYDLALEGFEAALAADPDGPLAPTAQYWIGETLLARGDLPGAISAFEAVISRWPTSEKRPAAELRKGVALVDSGQEAAGKALLEQVVQSRPGSPEAQSAREYLQRRGLNRR